ncbi:MAG: acyltransferase domain-containing protein, partial [Isosphaeraceae bacterium]
IDDLARRWWRLHSGDHRLPTGGAVVANDIEALERVLDAARSAIRGGQAGAVRCEGGTVYLPQPGQPRGVAFVYPGLGNYYSGMGRELGLLWPEVLRRQEREGRRLYDQFAPEDWWSGGDLPRFADHRIPILGQVAVGSQVTEILRSLGIEPHAAIGYSMGESAALVALHAWSERGELARQFIDSRLFATELSGPCEAARRSWGLPAGRAVKWAAGIVPRSIEEVRAAIVASRMSRVYPLIRNTRDETVIGGERGEVADLVRSMGCSWLELPTVGTVHCEIGRSVESEYRALHDVATTAPAGIAFYSGVTARRYPVDRTTAADAIAAQATRPVDFAATIEAAYADGVGLFIEAGPGSSCTRLIGRILGTRPHTAVSACRPDRDAFGAVLDALAAAIAARRPVDLSTLYGATEAETPRREARPRAVVRVAVGPGEFHVTPLPSRRKAPTKTTVPSMLKLNGTHRIEADDEPARPRDVFDAPAVGLPGLAGRVAAAEQARIEAHRAYLKLAAGAAELIGRQLAQQLDLIARAGSEASVRDEDADAIGSGDDESSSRPAVSPALYDRRQCLELAVGSVAAVFGPEFAEVDRLPTRVRLPDEPLMFVDRITALEGRPRSMAEGRIITEHDVRPGAWYVEGGRVAPCVAMEAGQADLVLSGFLGVDFLTEGRSVYRLLDATVTFHRRLPVVGDVLRYDIRITKFFRQGTTILFRFEYDATVAGEPLITMRDGCAGFFTAEELASGKGITPARLDLRRASSFAIDRPDDLVPALPSPLDEAAVEALRRGELGAAFGAPFDRLRLTEPVGLPGGLMGMLRRVEVLDPSGGPAGLGLIRAEAEVRPGDWYMVCHFVDDRVMPGTLMYECCLHSLRILMMRLGWVGSRKETAFEPVPGVANRLKCRGQITESTRRVTYEVTIKERGYRPEPYAIADALIIADDRPIVSVTDLALQLSGTRREELEALWADSRQMQPVTR